MPRWLSWLIRFIVWPPVLVAGLYALFILVTPYNAERLPPLKDGDLVFQTINSPQTLAIIFATHSPYTHIGIVKMNGNTPFVVEAVGPVREIPLSKWVRQGYGKRIAISRIGDLKPDDAESALKAAKAFYGKPYDFYFLKADDAIYCSELVYKAFERGPHIMLGQEEKVGDLSVHNFAVRSVIRQRWHDYPPCNGSQDYGSCYEKIMSQPLVSPASIDRDAKLERLYTNYSIFR
jgi:hypothetical protein